MKSVPGWNFLIFLIYLVTIFAHGLMDDVKSEICVEDTDVVLRCESGGRNVTWTVDGKAENPERFIILGDGLFIRKVEKSDSKIYICSVFEPSTGTIVNHKIKLHVLHKPVFSLPTYARHQILFGYINGTVNLTCAVVADPQLVFKWERSSNQPIAGRLFNESSDTSILQIHVNNRTFGDYRCTAIFPYSSLAKYFSIHEVSKPHPPEFIELESRNTDSLDLGIHEPKEDEDERLPQLRTEGFRVEYKKVKANNWKTVDFNITEDNRYLLQELDSDSKYLVRAATRNPAGFSDFTNTSTYRTLSHVVLS